MAAPEENQVARKTFAEVVALAGVLALTFGVIKVAHQWTGKLEQAADIHLEATYLPLYTLFSLVRGLLAYIVSFLFTMVYGYVAARVAGAERVMLPILDILQSIPVLGFLPGLVLGLIHLFPKWNIGLELAAVLMIFTGQVWNMTFAFHASLKSVPEDLIAVSKLAKMSWWQRFIHLDLSYSATGLVWNSMMSMAGGWFFLTVCEAFPLGEREFRLPGVGAYMKVAIDKGDTTAELMGVLAMLTMIVVLDQVVWRPVVAWSQRFSPDEADTGSRAGSWIWNWLRQSRLWRGSQEFASLAFRRTAEVATRNLPKTSSSRFSPETRLLFGRVLSVALIVAAAYGCFLYLRFVHTLTAAEWGRILLSLAVTFVRVMLAVALATLWTVPVGVKIGRSQKWSRILQPIIQMTASFPAPMLYPLVVGLVLATGGGLGFGSILLLLLGTQWYILFNVIAGASAIPKELWEVSALGRLSLWLRWKRLILPAIFPALLTGWITAAGGAWNASIVAEYMKYKGQLLSTLGLGALISQATDEGQFHVLAAAVGIMSLSVVAINRTLWRPLNTLARERFNLSA